MSLLDVVNRVDHPIERPHQRPPWRATTVARLSPGRLDDRELNRKSGRAAAAASITCDASGEGLGTVSE
jgi:hypothetical protein